MMSRKHYEMIASAISVARAGSSHHPAHSGAQRVAAVAAIERAADGIALKLKQDNPRFDRETFMRAAGF